jgi:predicted DNA-binding transcriptional regulator YafY
VCGPEFEVAYAELAGEFDVSEMTIRRDVEALEAAVCSVEWSAARSR